METTQLLPRSTQDIYKISLVNIWYLRECMRIACTWLAVGAKFLSIFFSIALVTYASHRDSEFEYNDDTNIPGTKGKLEDDAQIFYATFGIGVFASILGPFTAIKCRNFGMYFTLVFIHFCITLASMAIVTYREVWFAFNMVVITCILDSLNVMFTTSAIMLCGD